MCVCVNVCMCVHVYVYTPVSFKLRPLAVTSVLITLQPEQPQALSPLLLFPKSFIHTLSSPLFVFLSLSLFTPSKVQNLSYCSSHLHMIPDPLLHH